MAQQQNRSASVGDGRGLEIKQIVKLLAVTGPRELFEEGKDLVIGERDKFATWIKFLLFVSLVGTFTLHFGMWGTYQVYLSMGHTPAQADASMTIYVMRNAMALLTLVVSIYCWLMGGHALFLSFVSVGVARVGIWLLSHGTRVIPKWMTEKLDIMKPEQLAWIEKWQVKAPIDWPHAKEITVEFLGGCSWLVGTMLLMSWFTMYHSLYHFLIFGGAMSFLIMETHGWKREWYWMKYIQDFFAAAGGFIAIGEIIFTFSFPMFWPWFQTTVLGSVVGYGPIDASGNVIYPTATRLVWFIAVVIAAKIMTTEIDVYNDSDGQKHTRFEGKNLITGALILMGAYGFSSNLITILAAWFYGTGSSTFGWPSWSSFSLTGLLTFKTVIVVFGGLLALSMLRSKTQEEGGGH